MDIDQILATITALQEAGVDPMVIKKMLLQMLADDSGAAVQVPADDQAAPMSNQPPEDQGAPPITNQPMQARNQAPTNRTAPRPAAYNQNNARPSNATTARPSPTPQRPAPPTGSPRPQNNLSLFASMIGTALGSAQRAAQAPQASSAMSATTARPSPTPQRPAPAIAPQVQQYTEPQAADLTAEDILEQTLFDVNEQQGVHAGHNSEALRKVLRQNPALYAELIGNNAGVTPERSASPIANINTRPLQNVAAGSGVQAERQALANQAIAYQNTERQAGRVCTYSDALTHVINRRGPSRQS